MISPEEFIKAKYNLEFTAGDDHIYIEYLEKELKAAWETIENLKNDNKQIIIIGEWYFSLRKNFEDLEDENKQLKANNKGLAEHCNNWMDKADEARRKQREIYQENEKIKDTYVRNISDFFSDLTACIYDDDSKSIKGILNTIELYRAKFKKLGD